MFALSTETTRPRRDGVPARRERRAARSARSPRPSRRTCRAPRRRGGRDRRSRCRPSARARSRRQLRAHAPRAAGWRRRAPGSTAPVAGWRTGRVPCADRAGPAPGAARRGRSCPTSGRRPRPAAPRRHARQRSSTSGSERHSVLVDRDAADRSSVDLEAGRRTGGASASSSCSPAADHLGSDAVARQGDDCSAAGGYGPPAAASSCACSTWSTRSVSSVRSCWTLWMSCACCCWSLEICFELVLDVGQLRDRRRLLGPGRSRTPGARGG